MPVQDFSALPRPHSAITYILRGRGEIVSPDGAERIEPGNLLFTPMGSCYTQHWDAPHHTTHISCRFIFHKPPPPFAGKRFRVQILPGFDDSLSDFDFILKYHDDPAEHLAVMMRFYALCGRFAPKLIGYPLPQQDPLILRAVEYIEANCCRHLSVEELAKLCHLSVPHFYSRFRKAMGCPPIAYKQRAAIQQAQRLLIDMPAMTIEEIAHRTGFESVSYFRRAFQAVSGMTPSAYRFAGDIK